MTNNDAFTEIANGSVKRQPCFSQIPAGKLLDDLKWVIRHSCFVNFCVCKFCKGLYFLCGYMWKKGIHCSLWTLFLERVVVSQSPGYCSRFRVVDSELENLELSLVSVIKELGDLEKFLHLSGPVSSLIQWRCWAGSSTTHPLVLSSIWVPSGHSKPQRNTLLTVSPCALGVDSCVSGMGSGTSDCPSPALMMNWSYLGPMRKSFILSPPYSFWWTMGFCTPGTRYGLDSGV